MFIVYHVEDMHAHGHRPQPHGHVAIVVCNVLFLLEELCVPVARAVDLIRVPASPETRDVIIEAVSHCRELMVKHIRN